MGTRNSCLVFLSGILAIFCCSHTAYADTAPCDLLTQTQVSDAVGVRVTAGAPIATTGCSWTSTGKSNVTVTVSLQSDRMFEGAKRGANTPVSGIGDEAFFTGVQNFSSLWVRKGTKYLLVRIYGLSVTEAQPKLKSLATTAVSKL